MTPTDRIRSRTVQNQLKLVQEHLEAMQRDVHGLEYARWKLEVDELWKRIFSTDGTRRLMARPQRISSSVLAPRGVPRYTCSATALTICGCEWPRMRAPWPLT